MIRICSAKKSEEERWRAECRVALIASPNPKHYCEDTPAKVITSRKNQTGVPNNEAPSFLQPEYPSLHVVIVDAAKNQTPGLCAQGVSVNDPQTASPFRCTAGTYMNGIGF